MQNTPNATVARLIHAATADDDTIADIVKDLGLGTVARTLAEEVAFRADEPRNETAIHVALDVVHGDERVTEVFRVVRNEHVRVADEHATTLASQVGIDVSTLLRQLYGIGRDRLSGSFDATFLPPPPDQDPGMPPFELVVAATQATNSVLSGCAVRRPELRDLSVRYGSDKWGSFHWYAPHYERHFGPMRDEVVRVLEIGIGGYGLAPGGGSLKMWKRFFHRGFVFGMDVFDKSELNEPRLTALTGDQSDPAVLAAIVAEHGPFDIIVDDGSHMNEHQLISFQHLFPHLRAGGLYVIEDLQTSYWPGYGGSGGPVAGPGTGLGLVKQLLDDLHHREHWGAQGPPTDTQRSVVGVHSYHNVVFIEKGVNGEDTLPSWVPRELPTWLMEPPASP